MKENKGTIKVTVQDGAGRRAPIAGALVHVSAATAGTKGKPSTNVTEELEFEPVGRAETGQNGHAEFELEPGTYWISVTSFVEVKPQRVQVKTCDCTPVIFDLPVGF